MKPKQFPTVAQMDTGNRRIMRKEGIEFDGQETAGTIMRVSWATLRAIRIAGMRDGAKVVDGTRCGLNQAIGAFHAVNLIRATARRLAREARTK